MYTQARTMAEEIPALQLETLDNLQKLPGLVGTSFKQNCNSCSMHKVCLVKSVGKESRQVLNAFIKHPRSLPKGGHFYRQSDDFVALYVVYSGAVKTYFIDEKGEEHITGLYLPGELFGFDGIGVTQHRYSAKAIDTSAVCEFNYYSLEESFQAFPEIQRRITEILCAEIFQRQQPLLSMRQNTAEERLATFVTNLSARLKSAGLSPIEFNLPLSRRDIAGYLGLVEETVSRTFTRFQKRELMWVSGRSVSIMDLTTLQEMSATMY